MYDALLQLKNILNTQNINLQKQLKNNVSIAFAIIRGILNIYLQYTYKMNIFFTYTHFFTNIVMSIRRILLYTLQYTPVYSVNS